MAVDDDAGPQFGQADLAADLGVDGQVSLGHIEFVGERETWPAAARSLPGFQITTSRMRAQRQSFVSSRLSNR